MHDRDLDQSTPTKRAERSADSTANASAVSSSSPGGSPAGGDGHRARRGQDADRSTTDSDADGRKASGGSDDSTGGGARKRQEGGRLKRLTGETRGLVDDLKEWVDLKIQLIQIDFEDRIRQAANQAALTAVVIVTGLFAVLFGLVAAGEALGIWFGNRPLGFVALAALLALLAGVIQLAKPRLVERAAVKAQDEADDDARQNQLANGSKAVHALPEPESRRGPDHEHHSTSSDDHR